jgi:hypothetical protein
MFSTVDVAFLHLTLRIPYRRCINPFAHSYNALRTRLIPGINLQTYYLLIEVGNSRPEPENDKSKHLGVSNMLYTIAVVLIILWLLGMVTSFTMGGFIHILLIIAIVVVLLRVISGRKVL